MSIEQMKEQDKLFRSYQRVFSTPDGKEVLKDLCQHCRILVTTKAENPYEMYFNEGQRSIGMHILTMLNMDLIKFRQLIKSHSEGVNDDEI